MHFFSVSDGFFQVLLSSGASETLQDKDGHTAADVVCDKCLEFSGETCRALDELLSPQVA